MPLETVFTCSSRCELPIKVVLRKELSKPDTDNAEGEGAEGEKKEEAKAKEEPKEGEEEGEEKIELPITIPLTYDLKVS